jgi:hypothetical protein
MIRKFFTQTLPQYGQLMLFVGGNRLFFNSLKDENFKNKLISEMDKSLKLQEQLTKKDSITKELLEKALSDE